MECKNHPGTAAIDRCSGCAETFCFNCLVEIQGGKYCASCKWMLVQDRQKPPLSASSPGMSGYPASPYQAPGMPPSPMGMPPSIYGYGPRTQKCSEATTALVLAIVGLPVGLLCCVLVGVGLQIGALVTANQAKQKIAANPYLTGEGQATAAQVIAVIGLILCALGFFASLAMNMQQM